MSSSRSDEKEQERFWNEFRVGVFAVVGITLLLLGFQFLKGVPLFGGTYTLVADFETANGVTTDVPVTVRGIPVGTVQKVHLSDDGGVRVRMRIQNDVELREGTTASITGMAALDDVRVSLNRSSDGPPLSDGARLPTQNEGLMDKLREKAVPMAGRVDSVLRKSEQTLTETKGLIGGSRQDVHRTISNLKSTSAGIESIVERQRERLHRTLVHLERTSASMDTLVHDLQAVTSSNRDSLGPAVSDARRTLRRTRRASKSVAQSADDLDHILTGLREGEGTAGQLLTDERLYQRLHSISVRTDSILADFQENPSRYLDTSVELF